MKRNIGRDIKIYKFRQKRSIMETKPETDWKHIDRDTKCELKSEMCGALCKNFCGSFSYSLSQGRVEGEGDN